MTLIEVMVAAAIFAVGVSAILSAVGSYIQVVEHERRLGDAWRILQAEAGHLRTLPDSAPEWLGPSTAALDAFGLPPTQNSPARFTIERTPVANEPVEGARQLTLQLRWQERAVSRTTTLVLHR